MSTDFEYEMSKKLEATNIVSYNEINDILNAFQIASGQGFAIGKTKALLSHLNKKKELVIENYLDSKEKKSIHSIYDLAILYKHIDPLIDIENDIDFKVFFV